MKTKPFRLYILVRNDLPSMNPGKAMAQVAHAANQFVYEKHQSAKSALNNWKGEGCGFGTTIVLSVDEMELHRTISRATYLNVSSGLVYDTTYPMIVSCEVAKLINPTLTSAESIYRKDNQVMIFRKEVTCGYVFVENESSEQAELVGALPLHP